MTGSRLHWLRLSLLLLLVGLGAGCGPSGDAPGHQGQEPAGAPGRSSSHAAPAAQNTVELRPATFQELDKTLQAQKGKIVVVDLWATWCTTCMQEFPHLVELHDKFGKDGVACISVTVDAEKDKAAALAFLQAQKATFPNLLLDEAGNAWQERWTIKGLPAVLVYGRDGMLVRTFTNDDPDNQFTYADVTRFVKQLLAKTR
jgi:thiol-disulfide isomerase/thioredoxin